MNQRHKTILIVVCMLMATSLTFAMYDTHTGRFLQQDPIGIQPEENGTLNQFGPENQYTDCMNLYQYVISSPISGLDALGLKYDPHGEKDPEGAEKAKSLDKCFCITSTSIYGKALSNKNWIGANCNINIHGYWKKWPSASSCSKDGRADVHWWEWFNETPTHNPKGIYDDKEPGIWHDLQSVRITHPPKPHYSYHDTPGLKPSPGSGEVTFEGYVLAAAMSHPDCQCPGIWIGGAHVLSHYTWHQVGGLTIWGDTTFDLYHSYYDFPNRPTPEEILRGFNKW